MDIRNSVYEDIATRSGEHVTGIQLGSLVQRLLLFDRVVLRSYRLREMPFLVRAFGISGFRELLNLGILKIACPFTTVISGMAINGVPTLPPFHFSFATASIQDPEGGMNHELRRLQGVPGLKNVERTVLEEKILSSVCKPSGDYASRVLSQIESDMRGNLPILTAAFDYQLKRKFGQDVPPVHLHVEETDPRIFHIVSDGLTSSGMEHAETQQMMELATRAVGAANQRLADMQEYASITGFADDEAPILFGKLSGIMGSLNPRPLEENFKRVITLTGLPDFGNRTRVDLEKLLKVRESSECQEFRKWLANLNELSDDQITEVVREFRSKIGTLLQSGVGKVFRFVVAAGIGAIPGAGIALGPALGAVDMFLLERLFPRPGYLAFLTQTYPSLFKE